MPTPAAFTEFIGVDAAFFSKEEKLFLEMALFYQVVSELKRFFHKQWKMYFHLVAIAPKEETMQETHYLRCIINDIIRSESYTLTGIAVYTHEPEELIYEVVSGENASPSWRLWRKIVDLHRTVRPELYQGIMRKLLTESISLLPGKGEKERG